MTKLLRAALLFTAAMLPVTASSAYAATGVTFGNGATGNSEQTRGWSFTLSQAVNVSALGWWDLDGNGLVAARQVSIFSSAGAQLLTGTVASGTSDPLAAGFRYTSSLTGVTSLAAGDYVIGGLSTASDTIAFNVTNAVFGSGITYTGNLTNGILGVFSFPNITQDGLDVGVFGPNFKYSVAVAAVPEPATWAMMLFGFAAIGFAVRHRRSVTAQVSYAA